MSMPSISAVIMTRNEEKNIQEAISSVSFASQIIVADTGSSDRTVELARGAGAEVHCIEFDGYGSSKNRALELGDCEWIISIDADERVSPELADNIVAAVKEGDRYDGYEFCRLTYFLGKAIKHSGWYPDYVLRLFKRKKGKFSTRLVHEGIELSGDRSRLNGLLLHQSYRTLESYLDKMNVYSSLNAQELYRSGRKYTPLDLIIHPPSIFVKMYIQKLGFLDGFHGLMLAGLSSYHVLIKYLKLREMTHDRGR